ncbi:hypothetical protein SC1000_02485 [Aggregatibacter actinomycetemcomitans]|nr:hypothetical protein SC1000_02485 [Aggregatibacter actinomycetemcomitans]
MSNNSALFLTLTHAFIFKAITTLNRFTVQIALSSAVCLVLTLNLKGSITNNQANKSAVEKTLGIFTALLLLEMH